MCVYFETCSPFFLNLFFFKQNMSYTSEIVFVVQFLVFLLYIIIALGLG